MFEEIARDPSNVALLHLVNGLIQTLLLRLLLVLDGRSPRGIAVVEAPDVVAPSAQEEDVVSAAAAGDEGRLLLDGAAGIAEEVPPVVAVLGGRHEVGPLVEQVVEGEGRGAAVPGGVALLPELLPAGAVGGEGGGTKGVL